LAEELRKFTVEELKQYNGEDGRPAYVGYEDRVIDVTGSKMWRKGSHMKRHQAGEDLTAEIGEAPHATDVLDRFPRVGILVREAAEEESAERPMPKILARMLQAFPFLDRHPHPMTAHFPVALMILAPLFTLLYLITGVHGFEITALNCLGAGLLFSLVTIMTGFFTWWLNYFARPMAVIIIKISVSSTMFVVGLVAFIWRLKDPTVLDHLVGINILYLVLILSLFPMIAVVGWYGATLTFPLPKKKK
jgi:predicted heme/steroid binding protein/uncharacterized membrane protein